MASLTGAALAVLLVLAGPAYPRTSSSPPSVSASSSFEDLARRASEEREAGRLEEAIRLYGRAVGLRPDWAEGWWYLGTIAYDRDRFPECRDAFRRLVELEPQGGTPWALLALCEFRLREYALARRHVDQAMALGLPRDEGLWRVVLYHRALLLIEEGQFELALEPLTQLVRSQTETPELVEACGLVALRRAEVPEEVPAGDRDLLQLAGEAYCAYLARRADRASSCFARLLERYPAVRHLHYARGLFLAQQGSPEAADAFRREIALHRDHVLARVELAFELLRRGEVREARQVAEAAVRLDPDLFAPHLALGRALVEEEDLTLGIHELETAARLAPGIPEIQWSLGKAYGLAGRDEDAERAREAFQKLDAARRASAPPAAPSSP